MFWSYLLVLSDVVNFHKGIKELKFVSLKAGSIDHEFTQYHTLFGPTISAFNLKYSSTYSKAVMGSPAVALPTNGTSNI